MTYHLTTLNNGLRVATEFLPGVESVSIAVSVGVGARYESLAENGLSHLLEHMAFKGTATRSAKDIAEAFDNIGGQLNAYTSMEMTVYYAKVLKKDAAFALEILGDILQNSTFAEEELAKEKDVIVQEIAMHQDSPEDLIVDQFDITAFPDQPLGRSILGAAKQVSAYTRDEVMGYMRRHYVPSNIIVSAAGNLDHGKFVSDVERFFALAGGTSAPAAPVARYAGGEKHVKSDHEQLHVALGFPAVNIHDPRYYALQLYASILGGGMSSRLFQEVREKRGLAYSVYAMGSGYQDVGLLSIYAATSPEKATGLVETVRAEVEGMGKQVSDTELARAKNQSKAELQMSRESSQTVAGWMGRHLLMYGEYKQLPAIFEKIDAVTKEDVQALATVIGSGAPTFAMLGEL
ncbi:MAG: pitrilysin family protein [Alphaproteobacteria bacterium]|nr:pitrilysin family protein [Alphaproteobacteria bacterium]